MFGQVALLIAASLAYASAIPTQQITCYSCQYNYPTPGDIGYECVVSPENFTLYPNIAFCSPITNTCVSQKMISKTSGKVFSMLRGCNYQGVGVGCFSDPWSDFETCYQVCTGDLCNDNNIHAAPVHL